MKALGVCLMAVAMMAVAANAATLSYDASDMVWNAATKTNSVKIQYDTYTDGYYLNGNTAAKDVSGWANGVYSYSNASRNNDSSYWLAGANYCFDPTVITWKFDFSATGETIKNLSVRNDILATCDGTNNVSAAVYISTNGTNWTRYVYQATDYAANVKLVTDGGAYHDLTSYVAGSNVYYIQAELYHFWGKDTPQLFRTYGSNSHYDAFVNNVVLTPEPTTIGLVIAGIAGLLRRRVA